MQQKLLPELIERFKKRYTILQHIMMSTSIGRRTLATSLQMTERVLRAETDLLKTQGLIEIDNTGMCITDAGRILVQQLAPLIRELLGMRQLEDKISQAFALRQVVVVHGNADESFFVKQELGQAACHVLNKVIEKNDIIAVTGGSTLAVMAEQLTSTTMRTGNLFVPARGGLGESLEYQANTIASTLAKRMGAQYRLLHVPDLLSEEAYQSLKIEPIVQDMLRIIRAARIVVHGIGEAFVMAKRRHLKPQIIQHLMDEGALAEAFGYYFDRNGRVVHTMRTLGLQLEDLSSVENVIAVAGGHSKGEAIASILRAGYNGILIIDEAAAIEVLKHCGLDVS